MQACGHFQEPGFWGLLHSVHARAQQKAEKRMGVRNLASKPMGEKAVLDR